jgi:adenylate cyclase
VWGDTVNTASRMESSGVPGEINVSAFLLEQIAPYIESEPRGAVEAKGKGLVEMHLVRRLQPAWSADAQGTVANAALLETLDVLDADRRAHDREPHGTNRPPSDK